MCRYDGLDHFHTWHSDNVTHPVTALPQKWNCGMDVTVFPFHVIQPCKKKWVTSHTVEERIVTSSWADARPHTRKTRRDIHSDSAAGWSKALQCVDIVKEFVNEVFRCKWIGLRARHLPRLWSGRPEVHICHLVTVRCEGAQKWGTYNRPLESFGFHYTSVRRRCSQSTRRRLILCHISGWCTRSHSGESGTQDP